MIRKLTIALCSLVTIYVVVGLWLPRHQRVERSIVVDRPALTLFTLLNGFRHFQAWSPWVDRDPQAEYLVDGPDSGVGARITWEGDPRLVGTGSLEIVNTDPPRRIDMHLDFGPQGSARTYFQLVPRGASTALTWGLLSGVSADGSVLSGLMGRYLGLFLDPWVGPDFARGLSRLKRYAEALPAAPFAGAEIEIVDVKPVRVIMAAGTISQSSADVSTALAGAFADISAFLGTHGLHMAGQPMAITRARDETGFRFDAAVPIADELPPLNGKLRSGMSPGGRAVRIVHRGPYDRISESYEKLLAFMAARGLTAGDVSWEHYVEDPAFAADEEQVTHIYVKLQQ